ncbi:MAG: helix-turn-helix domain-containing protein [Verrucomicrobia bacterium]|nr:helix-turn-helix domain-containing protein [Verrucomicrobiota bacterium]
MKLRINGIGTYGPGRRIGPACWPHHDLIVVTEGSMVLRCGRQPLTLLAHDAILIPPGTSFAGASGEGGGTIWVQHFSAQGGDMPTALRRRRPMVLRGAAGSEVGRALLRRLHALRERNAREALLLRHVLFRALLLELAQAPAGQRPARPEAQRLQQAIDWAEANPGEARNLSVVARQADISESHFRALFARLRGQPAGAWLRERRMAEARWLLTSTRLTLKEVAAKLGYGDVVSFTRAFGQHQGTPPGRFRRTGPQMV